MTKFLKTNYNQTIAYNKIDGEKLGIVFLSGLKSDMTGQKACLLYTSPSPRDTRRSRMPSSA